MTLLAFGRLAAHTYGRPRAHPTENSYRERKLRSSRHACFLQSFVNRLLEVRRIDRTLAGLVRLGIYVAVNEVGCPKGDRSASVGSDKEGIFT